MNNIVDSVQHSCIRHFFENRFFTFSYIVFDGASTGIEIKVIGWKLAKMWSFVYPCQKFTLVYEPIHECRLSWTTLNQDLHSCICYIHERCSRKFDWARGFVIIKYYLTTVYVWLLKICSTFIYMHFAVHCWSKITHLVEAKVAKKVPKSNSSKHTFLD